MNQSTTSGTNPVARSGSFESAPSNPRASILMVDDQPARLLTYEAMLNGIGVECVRALSGRQALEKLLRQEFAVILLDVEMPEMDGFEVARLIREHPRMERTPIIFVTGVHVSELDRLKGYEVGAIDYIAVPVVPDILRSKVAMLVELHQRRSELKSLNAQLQQTRDEIQAEHAKALADKDAEMHAAFEHPTDMTIVLQARRDATGQIFDWTYLNANGSALRYLRRQREDVIGHTVREVLGERADAAIKITSQVNETKEPTRYERRVDDRDLLITIYPAGFDRVISSGVDITDRKQAEAAVKDTQRRDHALIDSAPVGFAFNSLDGRFAYANPAFCELVGFTPAELREMSWQDLTHPDDVRADMELAQQVLQGERSHYTLEKRYVRKDGSHVWVNLFGNFVRDDMGRPGQGVAIVVDITAKKLADKALQESQQRLLLAKQAAQLGIYDLDLTTGVLRWDDRVYELFWLDPKQPVDLDVFTERIHPDDRAQVHENIARAREPDGNRRYAAQYRVQNPATGEMRWVESLGQVTFENGYPARLVGAAQDVTDEKAAQQLLREREERFRELANNIDQFAWTCQQLGCATWYNDRWYQYTGTSFEDMQGEGWKRAHDPDELPRIIESQSKAMAQGRPWEDIFRLRAKDGSYRWFLTRAVPIRDANGAVVRWFGTNTDVTEQRQLQEALEQTDRRKDEFLAMLAHELRNPIAPIRNAAEVLARLFANDPRPSALISMIQRQGAHLSRILDDLLDVARITQGHIELRREVLPIAACVDLALETVQPQVAAKGHRVAFTRTSQTLYVSADKVRLEQCISNLLANAVKYTDAGGDIRVQLAVEGDNAVIRVSDNGVGMAPEFIPHMFDLFAQGERALDRSEGGLGIGLSVCKQLMQMHGGSVSGESEGVGRGATFTMRLPLHVPPASRRESAVSGTEISRRVLIVDDNRDAADSLAMCLVLEGHDAKAVYSAESAIEQCGPFSPDIVLLDIGLPVMNGYEVARQIHAAHPTIRVVALTGYGQEEDKQRTASAGFAAHLVKPVDVSALQALLRQDFKR